MAAKICFQKCKYGYPQYLFKTLQHFPFDSRIKFRSLMYRKPFIMHPLPCVPAASLITFTLPCSVCSNNFTLLTIFYSNKPAHLLMLLPLPRAASNYLPHLTFAYPLRFNSGITQSWNPSWAFQNWLQQNTICTSLSLLVMLQLFI